MSLQTLSNCRVIRVESAEDSSITMLLKNRQDNSENWYKANPVEKQELLELALAAFTGGLQVEATVDPSNQAGSVHGRLDRLVLMRTDL